MRVCDVVRGKETGSLLVGKSYICETCLYLLGIAPASCYDLLVRHGSDSKIPPKGNGIIIVKLLAVLRCCVFLFLYSSRIYLLDA